MRRSVVAAIGAARAPDSARLEPNLGGIPHVSPHSLRRRRGALHYKRTGSLAEVAKRLGDSKRVAAEHYGYALTDYREVEYGPLR